MLYYRKKDNGNKDWIVFIHPLGGSSITYYKQIKDMQKRFNLLLVDLHGHGKSDKGIGGLTIRDIPKDILAVMDQENIQSAHFVGMCLGNVMVDLIYEYYPHRIKSIVYGAAAKQINFINSMLLKIGNIFKHIMPHSTLYNLFALIMMPNKNHKESRRLFVREAKKMKRNDFMDWYNLIIRNQKFYANREVKNDAIKKLYIFGSEDHLFISKAKGYVEKDSNSRLHIIAGAGHMCNIDGHRAFNKTAMQFFTHTNRGWIHE
ncbi:Pimeloyl-ACP methyl ester carboxylesterase [Peptoclostridium litorale DSM 5388]|uniref:AB hydrolase-1 domain-containing protein n=1 Tax=Peptoclostridium litorale DSM 5388 TaxID=1121324 RepID=A0A069RHP1_PEPLI|nr:alpha/beta hydrolase [Peptoclostridium litorale]KDR95645.1 hypothetical protein CLIT_10c03720 [Peptoclostridium litorale DSM 5388]SIO00143.1 Pimeloyl-ACP methyl ester carboxylesterase [Peptoclostridium litorale DSM 5388]